MSRNLKLVFLSLFFVSGSCGLIYQIVWSRLLILVFGGTTFAITTVISCFMGGLALGSYLAGRVSDRITYPMRTYGVLEIAIGFYCLFVPFLLDSAEPLYRGAVGIFGQSFFVLTVLRIAVTALILVIPTAFMGATLPILSKAFVHREEDMGRDIARLYGMNTTGAFVGCFVVGFFFLPILGLRNSIWIAAGLNAAAGVSAILLSLKAEQRFEIEPSEAEAENATPDVGQSESIMSRPLILWMYGLSGFAAMAYQIAWTRGLILSLGSSTYAFSAIVSCFIFGLALGSFLISPWIERMKQPLLVAGVLEAVIGLSALIVVPLFGEMPGLVKLLTESQDKSFEGVLAIETACVLGLLIVPTLCMGALMPLVCTIYDPRPEATGHSVANVYASNTAGTILGSFMAGFILIPAEGIGMQKTIMLASVLSGIVATAFILSDKRLRGAKGAVPLAVGWGVGIFLGFMIQPWAREVMVMGPYLGRGYEPREILFYREGIDTTVAVSGTQDDYSLLVNGKPDASLTGDDLHTQFMTGLVPLFMRPESKEVCLIGLGSGATGGAMLTYPIEHMDVAEISQAVVEAAVWFNKINNHVLDDPRVDIQRADGRNLLLLTDRTYDLIISEPSNPWISGVANLFTQDFFKLSHSRLKPGGLHAQWIQGYAIDKKDFVSVLHTFTEEFAYTQLWEMAEADFLILGSDEPIVLDLDRLYTAFGNPKLKSLLRLIYMNDPTQLAYHFLGDRNDMKAASSGAILLTDDLPHLEFSAPKHVLQDDIASIKKVLAGFQGQPVLAGGAELTASFMAGHENLRRGMQVLDRIYGRLEANTGVDFDDMIRTAAYFETDVRRIRWIVQAQLSVSDFLRNPSQGPSPADAQFDTLGAIIPDFVEFQKEAVGMAPKFARWPFALSSTALANEEVRALHEEARRTYGDGDAEDSLRLLSQARQIDPEDYQVLLTMGRIFMAGEAYADAVPLLLQAYVRNPTNPIASFSLATALAGRGDFGLALDVLEYSVYGGHLALTPDTIPEVLRALEGDARYQRLLDFSEARLTVADPLS